MIRPRTRQSSLPFSQARLTQKATSHIPTHLMLPVSGSRTRKNRILITQKPAHMLVAVLNLHRRFRTGHVPPFVQMLRLWPLPRRLSLPQQTNLYRAFASCVSLGTAHKRLCQSIAERSARARAYGSVVVASGRNAKRT